MDTYYSWIWYSSKRIYFPKKYAKTPHVRLACKFLFIEKNKNTPKIKKKKAKRINNAIQKLKVS